MKFVIDTEEIKRAGVAKDVFFHVLSLYFHAFQTDETCQAANRLGLNVKDISSYSISRAGKELVEKALILSEGYDRRPLLEYMSLADSLMRVFPEGVKPGTYAYWRASTPAVAERLRLLETVADVKVDSVLAVEAAKDYVESFGSDTIYMHTLPYFILKVIHEESAAPTWQSDLLSAIENIKGK